MTDPVRAIADAVLYEGYVLWPYRRSALKNTQRWTFGAVFPLAHAEGRTPGDDPWTMQTQCLVEGGADARVSVGVRFLHVVRRQVVDAAGRDVDAVEVGDERHLTWDEAVERELTLGPTALGALTEEHEVPVLVDGGAAVEDLGGAGRVVRTWEALDGCVRISTDPVGDDVHRVTVLIENTTAWAGGEREAALRRAFCSAHTVLRASAGGAFVSLTDPPPERVVAAEACENQGTWPVLVGEPGERHTLLSSPIILEDHPQIAPESPGDLFDAGEIDGLLILNILQLTDEEKAEARATDPRVREVLDRSEALGPDKLMKLHGRTVRGLQVRR